MLYPHMLSHHHLENILFNYISSFFALPDEEKQAIIRQMPTAR